jgi:microcystin-dependent protein
MAQRPKRGPSRLTFQPDPDVERLRREVEEEFRQLEGDTDSSASSMPVGAVVPYAGSAAPDGWLRCNGAAVDRTQYRALFAVCGVTYGPGNGATTFNIPNLDNRSPMGAGSTVALGVTGGALTAAHTHDVGTLAVDSHTHGAGTLVADSHTHSDGTLAVASHTHSDGTLTVAAHTHDSGTYIVAQVEVSDAAGSLFIRRVAATGWTDNAQLDGTAIAGGVERLAAAALDGTTDATAPDVTGATGSAAPDVSGNSGSASPDVTGATGSAAPDVTGATGSTSPACSGNTAGATAESEGSILLPVIGLTFIIYTGVGG